MIVLFLRLISLFFVIGRHRKFHLYSHESRLLCRPPTPDITTFTLDGEGKYGIVTCFELNYEQPAKTLLEIGNVDAVVYNACWTDELPFLTGGRSKIGT